VALAGSVPEHLLVLNDEGYADFVAQLAIRRSRIPMWEQHASSFPSRRGEPVRRIRALSVACPDQQAGDFFRRPLNTLAVQEDFQEPRLIPLDGRPHITQSIRQWLGDSRGHWEGNTLVIDTTNFSDKASFRGSSPKLHVVERFTRVAADALEYQFTVDDPTTWTKPWTAAIPMAKTDSLIYEFGCHEGNYSLPGILRGARVQEKAAADAATTGPK
jgi:hypothetical protein